MSIHFLLSILGLILDSAALLFYIHIFLGKRKSNVSLWSFGGALFGTEILLLLLSEFTYGNTSVPISILRLCSNLVCTFLLTLFFESSLKHRIFFSVSLLMLYALSELLSQFIVMQVYPEAFNNSLLPDIISLLMYPLLFFMMLFIAVFWNKKKYSVSVRYSFITLITPFITLIAIFNRNIFEISISHPKTYIAFVVCLLMINYINYFMLALSIKTASDKEYIQYVQQQNIYQRSKYDQLSATYKTLRAYHHDTQTRFRYIRECVESKKYDLIIPYLDESQANLRKSYSPVNTGNLVIDSFVSSYIPFASENRITFKYDFQLDPALIPISDYDLSILLGNLLDNAMNACTKIESPAERCVEMYIRTDQKTEQFIIYIINSNYKKTPSTEINELIHGYGLKNAEELTEKNSGIFTVKESEKNYETSCIIPLLPPPKNLKKAR